MIRWRKLGRAVMKTKYTLTLSALAGVALGAASIELLHAQARPIAYAIAGDIINDEAGYAKNFAPLIAKEIQAAGGKFLARGGKTIAVHGGMPLRVVIVQFDSLVKAQAWANAPATKSTFAMGEKYARLNQYIVEGLPE
jgi:uncharacterized protein (DUF1330 family)